MSFAILRIEKATSMAAIGSRAAHNLRTSPQAAPHADPAARAKNRVLVGPSGTSSEVVEAARARIETVGKVRKNAVLGVEVLMAASPDFFADKSRSAKDWQAWQDASMDWLRETFGAANVVSAVLHRDESTPHIQALVVPIHDGKLRASHWLDGPAKLAKLQDTYAARLAALRIRRGERGSKARHVPLRAFYRLAEAIAAQAKRPSQAKPLQLPARGLLGQVSKAEWDQLKEDLAGQHVELGRLRAESIAGRILAASPVGQELLERTERAERELSVAQAAVRQAQADIDAKRVHLAVLEQKSVKAAAALATLDSQVAAQERQRDALDREIQVLRTQQAEPARTRARPRGG